MMIVYREAAAADIRPALTLALRVFMEFEAPDFGPEAAEKFRADCVDNEAYINNYVIGKHLMFIALDGDRIVGLVSERGNGRISMLFVDGVYHRRGVGTALMSRLVCRLKLLGFDRLTLEASPYGLPFYLQFGFKPAGPERKADGFAVTPMYCEPNEIWDVLDARGGKTGRYAERGRTLEEGDYHLVVHVWKHNGRGEWLIDRRSLTRGTSMDGKWETTGGAAVAGDDSLTAALRETKEELGLDLDPAKGIFFYSTARHGYDGHTWLQDAWVFEHDCPITDVRFQEGETCEAMWATADKIREMIASGAFLGEWFYPYLDEMFEKWSHIQYIDGVPLRLKRPFDLEFIRRYGTVFKVFDDQGSGNLCFGVLSGGGRRYFVKFAGAPTVNYPGGAEGAVERLKRAVPVYRELAHPALIKLVGAEETGGGFAAVFDWVDAVCAHPMYPADYQKFRRITLESRVRMFEDILDFHIFAAEKGYNAYDLYNANILWKPGDGKVVLCDIDFYSKGLCKGKSGPWNDPRFASPEECADGASIDEVSTVYNMGGIAFFLLSDSDRSPEAWPLSPELYAAVRKATSDAREDRQQSLRRLRGDWRAAKQARTLPSL